MYFSLAMWEEVELDESSRVGRGLPSIASGASLCNLETRAGERVDVAQI